MKIKRPFTLTELLVVIAIIAILAGLLIPAIVIGKQKGLETQAKADMKTILTALKSVEGTYQQMVKGSSFNGKSADKITSSTPLSEGIKLGGGAPTSDTAYDYFIAELSDPKNSDFSTASSLNINKRRIVFLDPKSDYDPSKKVEANAEAGKLWVDPWGNRYVILIDTSFSGQLPHPGDSSKKLAGSAAVYSYGPNGEDDKGLNAADGTGTGKEDDIVSWM